MSEERPASDPRTLFSRGDLIAALIAAAISLAVFVFTAAPSVTLLDSGEFIVAAQGFGVPHPTGYPLWTLLAWLFTTFIPLGNAAWEITLLSGIFGALAVGIAALLIRSSAAWLHPQMATAAPRLTTTLAVSSALLAAFSLSFWSQATIVEVYTLHALLIGLYLLSLYAWLRRPASNTIIYWCFFTLSLAFGNHQLALSLAPLPFLIVVLLRRDLLWDLFVAAAVSTLIAYLTFALFTDSPVVIKAAIRLSYLVVTVVIVALWIRRFQLRWKLIAFLPLAILVGLLPYAYLPVASATNPPMNWGYTRTADGFFGSFNRSQYRGTLSDQSLRLLAKIVGVSDLAPINPGATLDDSKPSGIERLQTWGFFFWSKLLASFTPVSLLFLAGAVLAAIRHRGPPRCWLILLGTAFLLAAFLQPTLDQARIDQSGWWVQMPYHAHTNLIYGILCGIGLLEFAAILRRFTSPVPLFAAALLPLWPLVFNFATASQRDNWLGYDYGHEMLADLPPNSVVLGGTDPGRFIPTYLILGESPQPASVKRDPAFDRRDLTILTQNALADRHYLAYVRDHYSSDRPAPTNAFERWLGRATAYPPQPLVLPTVTEVREITRNATEERQSRQPAPSPTELAEYAVAAVSQWIFERNKAERTFYVEESFPLRWSYPHAIPDGLLYRIAPEPLAELPAEVIARDHEFWTEKTSTLLADSHFLRDFDAQRAYAQLRVTGGDIYAFRGLADEAIFAYRQALALSPINLDALRGITQVLWSQSDFDAPIELFDTASPLDPNNEILADLQKTAIERRDVQRKIIATEEMLATNPADLAVLERLLALHASVGNSDRVTTLLAAADPIFQNDPEYFLLATRIAEARGDWTAAIRYGDLRVAAEPGNPDAHYRLGRAHYAQGDNPAAVQAISQALTLGGSVIRRNLASDPLFRNAATDPELAPLFQSTGQTGTAAP